MWKIALCTIVITVIYWIIVRILVSAYVKNQPAANRMAMALKGNGYKHPSWVNIMTGVGVIMVALSVLAIIYLAIHVIVIL